ncbi:helix-turn-helix domain-containing protein [Bombilactobacillus bombi]|uniref:helix-turn-helix domain-containing protein n=1 Tax=Bombilactobacillus bombi TaxID=1303590 RepID=UPI0015E62BD3|nr:hypothetical protein [Bombilactobacillus bombi]MBA1433903.1 hypothetical protein [Bombilactobacillus bombi]
MSTTTLTQFDRGAIALLHQQGKTQQQIATSVGIADILQLVLVIINVGTFGIELTRLIIELMKFNQKNNRHDFDQLAVIK